MAKDQTPHIGIYGRRNAGKSSFINVLSGQEISIVSEIAGTTTDPVKKSIELFGAGPVIFVDTAGIDDTGELGAKRVHKTLLSIKTIDLAILIITDNSFGPYEEKLIEQFRSYDIPFIIIHNKSDIQPLSTTFATQLKESCHCEVLPFSSIPHANVSEVIASIVRNIPPTAWKKRGILSGLINANDIILLIVPIDTEAPEGRLILPQVQAIRDILDNHSIAIVLKETEVAHFLKNTQIEPKLVVTDSSIFKHANELIPAHIPLTGFSVLLARYRGPFEAYLKGTPQLSELKNGDKVLILESCTHQTTCDDIGRVKLPKWLREFTGKNLEIEVIGGLSVLPEKLTDYAIIIQCGACMITPKQVHSRLKQAIDAGIPVTNYGMAIAYMQGVYQRAIEPVLQ